MAISYTDDLQIRIDDYKRARTDIQQRTASQISREMEPLEEDIQMVEYINSVLFYILIYNLRRMSGCIDLRGFIRMFFSFLLFPLL